MFSKEAVANIDENPLRSCEQEEIALINVISISFQSKWIKQMASGLEEKISSLTETSDVISNPQFNRIISVLSLLLLLLFGVELKCYPLSNFRL